MYNTNITEGTERLHTNYCCYFSNVLKLKILVLITGGGVFYIQDKRQACIPYRHLLTEMCLNPKSIYYWISE